MTRHASTGGLRRRADDVGGCGVRGLVGVRSRSAVRWATGVVIDVEATGFAGTGASSLADVLALIAVDVGSDSVVFDAASDSRLRLRIRLGVPGMSAGSSSSRPYERPTFSSRPSMFCGGQTVLR